MSCCFFVLFAMISKFFLQFIGGDRDSKHCIDFKDACMLWFSDSYCLSNKNKEEGLEKEEALGLK